MLLERELPLILLHLILLLKLLRALLEVILLKLKLPFLAPLVPKEIKCS